MPKVTVETVDHVARLARLSLTDEERALFARQLDQSLEYAESIQSLDTDAVEPMSHALTAGTSGRMLRGRASPGTASSRALPIPGTASSACLGSSADERPPRAIRLRYPAEGRRPRGVGRGSREGPPGALEGRRGQGRRVPARPRGPRAREGPRRRPGARRRAARARPRGSAG